MCVHLLGIIIPIIPALIVYSFSYFSDKTDSNYIKSLISGLNWQIQVFIAYAICFLLSTILVGLLLFPIVFVLNFIVVLVAVSKARRGEIPSYFGFKLLSTEETEVTQTP